MERRVDACARAGLARSRGDGKRTALGAMAPHAIHLGTSWCDSNAGDMCFRTR